MKMLKNYFFESVEVRCMLMAGLMTSAVAQEQRFLDVNGWESAGISKSYDRQSQNAVYPMITLHDDGFIGCTWTTDDNPKFSGSVIPNRGVAYSYSTDGEEPIRFNT